jgi:hypothetical protein
MRAFRTRLPALAFEDNADVPYYADVLEAGNLDEY